ncbi:hypothetical protein [Streptomyces goshikiensis]|uniref:hypothetical protein n=1 Tax=Streptomyces goshikiensis TaxID=1942 RepID=UPI00365D1A44
MRRQILIPDHVLVVGNGSRAAIISDRRIAGLSAGVIAELVAEVGPLWHERQQAGLESRPRKRAVGASAKHRLVFVDRLLATLVHLRHGCTVAAGIRLRTLAEVIEHLGASRQTGIIDDTEIRVRRPPAGRKDREKSRRTRWAGTRRSTNASARRIPHAVSASNTASHTSRTGEHSPAITGRRDHMSDAIQAVAGLLSHQQTATRRPNQPQ